MNLLLYLIFIIIFVLIFMLLKNRSIIMTIICSILIIIIILNPNICINAAVSGAVLFFNKVFPSLFPFVVLSGMILAYDGINVYSKVLGPILCRPMHLPVSCSFVIIISALCGYPLGAKYACDLYENRIIDRNTCERLLNIASNPSPLFIIGAVGTSMLQNQVLGYILLASTYLSCFIMGIILPSKGIKKADIIRSEIPAGNYNFGSAMKESIEGAVKTSLSICGFVTIFYVINSILKSSTIFNTALVKISSIFHISFNLLQGIFLGIMEMTNGCNEISAADINLKLKITIISFLLAFSGISVIFQVYSFTYKYNFSLKKYVLLKFIQGFISSAISMLLICLIDINKSMPSSNVNAGRLDLGPNMIFTLILLMILPYGAGKLLNKLFHSF